MPAELSASQRRKVTERLKAIWSHRDIPPMPEQELRRVTDRDLAFLLRFWSHKDRYWDIEDSPPFREEPPQGYERMFGPVQTPSGDIIPGAIPKYVGRGNYGTGGDTPNCFHEFKGTGGGYLTGRQAFKMTNAAY